MSYQTKAFCDYGLMRRYVQVVEGYFADAKAILGDKMLMYMLTSSCSLDACIDGWSDIDILIVVEKLDFVELKALHDVQKKYEIEIVLRTLSRHEIMSEKYDDIISVVFYQIAEGMSAPNYVTDDPTFIIPKVSLKQVQSDDERMLPWQLERARRLLREPSDNKRMMIKHLYTIMKMCLRSSGHEIVTISYAETFRKFAEEFAEKDFDIMAEITSGRSISEEFIEFARYITKNVCNGKYH